MPEKLSRRSFLKLTAAAAGGLLVGAGTTGCKTVEKTVEKPKLEFRKAREINFANPEAANLFTPEAMDTLNLKIKSEPSNVLLFPLNLLDTNATMSEWHDNFGGVTLILNNLPAGEKFYAPREGTIVTLADVKDATIIKIKEDPLFVILITRDSKLVTSLVKPGYRVKAGQPLFEIKSDQHISIDFLEPTVQKTTFEWLTDQDNKTYVPQK